MPDEPEICPVSVFASRAALLGAGAAGRRYGEFALPISGLRVRFRSLSEGEFDAYEESLMERLDDGTVRRRADQAPFYAARLIVACLCDADGNQLLEKGDEGAITLWDCEDVSALFDELRKHLGIHKRAARARAEELAKN